MITEYIPKKSDTDTTTTPLDTYCDQCEQTIMSARGWSHDGARRHVGRFMHKIPIWAAEGITTADAVARMIGGNPAIGYR